MREVRKRRPVVERAYLAQFSRELTEFAANRRSASTDSSPPSLGNIELSLVGENELEESLAITSLISKNASRITRDLFALNQRLSVICGGIEVDDANNPVGPAVLTQTFRQAMRELSADMRVKLIIYKLFDRYVLSGLEELYQELNAELMRAGVLPQLRHGMVRGSAPQGTGSRTAAAGGNAPGGADVSADDAGNLLNTLHALFTARRGGHDLSGGLGGGSGPQQVLPTANELLGALSVLQSQMASQGLLGAGSVGVGVGAGVATDFDIAHEVAALKEHLLNQIGSLRGSACITCPRSTRTPSTWSGCSSNSSSKTATCHPRCRCCWPAADSLSQGGHPRSAPVCAPAASGPPPARQPGRRGQGLVRRVGQGPSPAR
jgi:hypothetical protein